MNTQRKGEPACIGLLQMVAEGRIHLDTSGEHQASTRMSYKVNQEVACCSSDDHQNVEDADAELSSRNFPMKRHRNTDDTSRFGLDGDMLRNRTKQLLQEVEDDLKMALRWIGENVLDCKLLHHDAKHSSVV